MVERAFALERGDGGEAQPINNRSEQGLVIVLAIHAVYLAFNALLYALSKSIIKTRETLHLKLTWQ